MNVHHLNNLIWVWSLDRTGRSAQLPDGMPERAFDKYDPGADCFDIASLDVHGEFEQYWYDNMLKVSHGKPITLAEVGSSPSLEVLNQQPARTWWMTWAGMAGGRSFRGGATANPVKILVDDPRSWNSSDEAHRKAIEPIRLAAGLPVPVTAPEIPTAPTNAPARPPGQ